MSTLSVAMGSLLAAILAYAFQVFGGRVLGPADFAPITVLWTVQFMAMQALYQPLEHYVNREVSYGRPPGIRSPLLVGAGGAVLTMGALVPLRDSYLDGKWSFIVMAGLLVLAYAIFGYVRGRLAGEQAFGSFGLVTAGEAGVRLVLAVSLAWAFGVGGLIVAMVVAPLVGLLWIKRTGVQGREDGMLRELPPLVGANACAQTLIGLTPLAAGLLGATPALVSMTFMTFAMYRGPLWVLQGVLARVLPVFVGYVKRGDSEALKRWMQGLAVGVFVLLLVVFQLGYHVAPPIIGWLVGDGFRPGALFSATVAAGVVVAACALVINQVLLAMDEINNIAFGWAIGLGVAVTTAWLVPGDAVTKVGVGFLAGEIAAFGALQYAFAQRSSSVRHIARVLDAAPADVAG